LGGAVRSRSDVNLLKVVKLVIDLDRTDPQRMRPGMRFLGTVEIERVPRALVAPAESVFVGADGPVVYRRAGGGSEPARPGLGRRQRRVGGDQGRPEGGRLVPPPRPRRRAGEPGRSGLVKKIRGARLGLGLAAVAVLVVALTAFLPLSGAGAAGDVPVLRL